MLGVGGGGGRSPDPGRNGGTHLIHQAAEDVEGLPPHVWSLTIGHPSLAVGVDFLRLHLQWENCMKYSKRWPEAIITCTPAVGKLYTGPQKMA